MRKAVTFLAVTLVFIFSTNAFAQVNEELTRSLNKVLVLEISSKRQCEYNSDKFNMPMPYHQIILDKENVIDSLTSLLINLGGKVEKENLGYEKASTLASALISDADSEIELFRLYNQILSKFGYPQAQRIIEQAQKQSQEHYMLLTNAGLRIISENREEK